MADIKGKQINCFNFVIKIAATPPSWFASFKTFLLYRKVYYLINQKLVVAIYFQYFKNFESG